MPKERIKKVVHHLNPFSKFIDRVMNVLLILLGVSMLTYFCLGVVVSVTPAPTNAEEPDVPKLSVGIGDLKFDPHRPEKWFGQYIEAWFYYALGAIGIFAVYRIMYGGLIWTTAGGNSSQIDSAKLKIKNAVVGLMLLLCSYLILNTINPDLLKLQLPPIDSIKDDLSVKNVGIDCHWIESDAIKKQAELSYIHPSAPAPEVSSSVSKCSNNEYNAPVRECPGKARDESSVCCCKSLGTYICSEKQACPEGWQCENNKCVKSAERRPQSQGSW